MGQTSLLEYLAAVVDVSLYILPIHAGTTESDIEEFVLSHIAEACWLFLDEINTCNHMALINVRVRPGAA